MQFIDTHTHTYFSPDGFSSPMDMCKEAVARGLSGIAFSEHLDCHARLPFTYFYSGPVVRRYDEEGYFAAITEAKEAFKGKLLVLSGVEIGQPQQTPLMARAFLERTSFDIVVGSLHNIASDLDYFTMQDFDDRPVKETIDNYFQCIDTLLDFGSFDTLAHMDYMLRYATRSANYSHTFKGFEANVEQILKKLINLNILLEINTAKFEKGIIGPEPFIVKMYHDLGGKAVTFASDAHHTSNIARGFSEAARMAKDCGITSGAYFSERNAHYYSL